jgi:hypothetical protein
MKELTRAGPRCRILTTLLSLARFRFFPFPGVPLDSLGSQLGFEGLFPLGPRWFPGFHL